MDYKNVDWLTVGLSFIVLNCLQMWGKSLGFVCLGDFPLPCHIFFLVCVLLWCSITMYFYPICEHCACMWKFFSPPGPLVFPGPIFMNQREQALARIRPLQALRHKRDKHKGTMVFTNSAGAETPLWPISQSGCPVHLLSLSEGRTL